MGVSEAEVSGPLGTGHRRMTAAACTRRRPLRYVSGCPESGGCGRTPPCSGGDPRAADHRRRCARIAGADGEPSRLAVMAGNRTEVRLRPARRRLAEAPRIATEYGPGCGPPASTGAPDRGLSQRSRQAAAADCGRSRVARRRSGAGPRRGTDRGRRKSPERASRQRRHDNAQSGESEPRGPEPQRPLSRAPAGPALALSHGRAVLEPSIPIRCPRSLVSTGLSIAAARTVLTLAAAAIISSRLRLDDCRFVPILFMLWREILR